MATIPTIDRIKDTTIMRMIRKLAGVTDEAIGKNAESMEQTFDEENRILATTLKTVDGTEISGSVYVPGGGDGGDIVVDTINYSESVPDVFNYIRAKYAEGTYNCNINIKADLLDGTKEGDNKISFNATQFTVSHLNLPDDEDIIYQIEFQGAGESALNGTAKWLILSYTPANTGDYKYGATVTIYSYESDKDAYVNQGWYINKDVGLTLKGFVIKGIKGAAITPYTASTGIKIDDEQSTIAVDSDVVMLKSIAINYTDAQFIDVYNDLKSKFPNNDFTCNLNVKCVGDATYEFVADSITIKDTHIAIGKTGVDCQIKPDGTAAISVRDSGGTWDVSPLTNPITIIGTVRNASTAITYTGENGIIVDNVDNVIKPDTDVLATKELAQKAYTSAYVENNTMTFEKGNGDTDTIALPTGGSYTAGDGITISDNEIAVDTSTIATTAVTTELASGISTNRNLINGTFDDVNISGNTITFTKVNGTEKTIMVPSGGDVSTYLKITTPIVSGEFIVPLLTKTEYNVKVLSASTTTLSLVGIETPTTINGLQTSESTTGYTFSTVITISDSEDIKARYLNYIKQCFKINTNVQGYLKMNVALIMSDEYAVSTNYRYLGTYPITYDIANNSFIFDSYIAITKTHYSSETTTAAYMALYISSIDYYA